MAEAQTIAAVALAGGASTRMGAPKTELDFLGEPLLARVIGRLRPQVDRVYLNARDGDGPDIVVDAPAWRGAGPLAGIAAALARAQADGYVWLATAPCDAPFLPRDLVARLRSAGGAAVAVSPRGVEPLFAVWPVAARAAIEAARAAGGASPRAILAEIGATRVAFEDQAAFANLNTPEEVEAARARADLLRRGGQDF